MQTKIILAVVAVLAVVGGAYFVMQPKASAPVVSNQKQAVHWTFVDKGEDSQAVPHTEVSLNGRVVGTYEGNCAEIDGTSWTLLPGEQSGVICYFAGGGTEIGIFDGQVKEGVVDEGSAEVAGTRGSFKTLFTL